MTEPPIHLSRCTLSLLILSLYSSVNGQLNDILLGISGQCENSSDIMHIDWEDLMADSTVAPNLNITMDVDDDTLTLYIEVAADFVGWATAYHGVDGYGMMYLIDFESLDGTSLSIQEAGTCSNRNGASREMPWEDNWVYSADTHRGVEWQSGAYVGNRYWELTTNDNGECNNVKWRGQWGWYDLLNCTNYDGDEVFVEIIEDTKWVNMTGALSVNLVSPLGLYADLVFTDPSGYDSSFSNNGMDISDGCMTSGFIDICVQLWTVEIYDVVCPTDLGGTYTFQFTLGCNPQSLGYENATALCYEYIGEYSGTVTLSADLQWEDTMCDPLIFEIEGQLSDTLLSINGQCENSSDIMHVDWDELISDATTAPEVNISMSVDSETLTLSVDVMAEFVGWASVNEENEGYGMMYIIDFDSFDASSLSIQEVGTCSNRNGRSRQMLWEDNWMYSADSDRGVDWNTGSYVSTRHWELTTEDDGECSDVEWRGQWTWYDLLNCTNYDGDEVFVDIVEDEEWVNMSGAVTVNLVSPLFPDLDVGFYRVYQLVTQPFVIAVHKTVNVIASTGNNLFVMTIIAVYREDLYSSPEMIMLTEAADYLQLYTGTVLINPGGYTMRFGNNGTDISGGCIASGSLCFQLWSIETSNIPCPADLSGSYTFQFEFGCSLGVSNNPDAIALCDGYIEEYSGSITLSTALDWEDSVCDPLVFEIQFSAEVTFYATEAYSYALGDGDQYRLGAQAYVEVVVGDPGLFEATNISLDNVWICTTHPDNEPLTVTQDLGTGGCLGGNLDDGFPKHIVQNQLPDSSVVDGDVMVYLPFVSNVIRFSFPIEYTLERANLYVHVQSTIDLTPGSRRRQLLLDDGSYIASATAHFADAVLITDITSDDINNGDDDETGTTFDWTQGLLYWLIGITIASCITIWCCFWFLFAPCRRLKKGEEDPEMILKAQIQANVASKSVDAKTPSAKDNADHSVRADFVEKEVENGKEQKHENENKMDDIAIGTNPNDKNENMNGNEVPVATVPNRRQSANYSIRFKEVEYVEQLDVPDPAAEGSVIVSRGINTQDMEEIVDEIGDIRDFSTTAASFITKEGSPSPGAQSLNVSRRSSRQSARLSIPVMIPGGHRLRDTENLDQILVGNQSLDEILSYFSGQHKVPEEPEVSTAESMKE